MEQALEILKATYINLWINLDRWRTGRMDLDQNSNYEWIGVFWFPDNERTDKFSGKVTYSPEQGIKLKLMLAKNVLNFDCNTDFMSGKLMHATVTGEKSGNVSLFNIWLNCTQLTVGEHPTVFQWAGDAELLIAGHLSENNVIDKIFISYDDSFNNIFLGPINRAYGSLRISESKPIKLEEGCTIGMDLSSWLEPFYSVEELDTLISASDKTQMEKLKAVAKPIIEDGDFTFFRRTEDNLAVSFAMKNKGFESYRKVEFAWRQFWQFIADQHISIKKAWVCILGQNEENKRQNPSLSALFSDCGQRLAGKKPPSQHQLPITINGFGEETSELNLSVIEKPILEWLRISNDKRYKPVLHGIQRAMQGKNKMVELPQYVSLVAEIETFLDLLGERNTNVDRLIELYADQEWKDKILELATDKSENETIGQWFHEIRNAIVHPKSSRDKNKGKYWNVASNPFTTQKAYAHLSGLYLKAILLALGNINPIHIDNYTKQYIRIRSSHKLIEFT